MWVKIGFDSFRNVLLIWEENDIAAPYEAIIRTQEIVDRGYVLYRIKNTDKDVITVYSRWVDLKRGISLENISNAPTPYTDYITGQSLLGRTTVVNPERRNLNGSVITLNPVSVTANTATLTGSIAGSNVKNGDMVEVTINGHYKPVLVAGAAFSVSFPALWLTNNFDNDSSGHPTIYVRVHVKDDYDRPIQLTAEIDY